MSRRLKLTFVGSDDVPYHTDVLAPKIARDVLARKDAHGKLRLVGDHLSYPLHHLTYAEVSRASRAVEYRCPDGSHVIITLEKD